MLTTILIFCSVRSAQAETYSSDYGRRFHWVSQVDLPGMLVHLAVRQPYGYLTDQGIGLRILDLTDPRNPIPLSSLALPGHAWDLCLHGKYACVSVYDQGLQVVDISNPVVPSIVGSIWTGSSIGVADYGDYVLLADFFARCLYTVSLEDPAHPQIVSELPTSNWPWDVAVSGELAVVTATYSVLIVDISDPLNPHRLGSVTVPDATYDVAVEGHHAYIGGSGRFYVVDFGDPEHPVLCADVCVPSMNWTVNVRDGFAFLGREVNGVSVFDVRDPSHPTSVAHFWTTAWGMDFIDDLLIVLDQRQGLQLLEIPTPLEVAPLAELKTPGQVPMGIALADPIAYLANWETGLVVVDLSRPTSPQTIAHLSLDGIVRGVDYGEGFVYLAGDHPALRIFDVVDPANPVLIGSTSTGGPASGVTIDNGFAYLLASSGLRVVDVHDPTHPTVVASIPGEATDIEIHGHIAYLIGGNARILDITDPAQPQLLSTVDVGFPLKCVTGDESYLYVGGSYGDFRGQFAVLSMGDPIHPTLVGRRLTMGCVKDVERQGPFVWLAEEDKPVLIIDVTRPEDPEIIGYRDLNNDQMGQITFDVEVGDRFVLAGNNAYNMLHVLPRHLPIVPVSEPSSVVPSLNHPSSVKPTTLVCDGTDGVSIQFATPSAGSSRIDVFDISGRVVRTIAINGPSGVPSATRWDGTNFVGQRVAPGIYFAQRVGSRGVAKARIVMVH